MTAARPALAAVLASLALAGCASRVERMRASSLPPPARESRAGASTRSAGPVPGSTSGPGATAEADRRRAVEAASAFVGQREIVSDGVDYGHGCVALVLAAFARAGHPLPASARDVDSLYAVAVRNGAL